MLLGKRERPTTDDESVFKLNQMFDKVKGLYQ